LFPLSDAYLSNDDHRFYSVSPDGQRFLMVRFLQVNPGENVSGSDIVLIENWLAELEQRN
jgi:hypothetical protein